MNTPLRPLLSPNYTATSAAILAPQRATTAVTQSASFSLGSLGSSVSTGSSGASEPWGGSSVHPWLTQFATTLLASLEQKDRVTSGHGKRTAHYAVRLARAMPDMTEARVERVRLAALLHDLGKLGIVDSILKKESPLTSDEWQSMQAHPQLGFDLLDGGGEIDFSAPSGATAHLPTGLRESLQEIRDAIYFHHERWDGFGYPRQTMGEQIPWVARLVAVADAYDAMVATRPYRKGLGPALAYQEILRQSGVQFDPAIVTVFAREFAAAPGGVLNRDAASAAF